MDHRLRREDEHGERRVEGQVHAQQAHAGVQLRRDRLQAQGRSGQGQGRLRVEPEPGRGHRIARVPHVQAEPGQELDPVRERQVGRGHRPGRVEQDGRGRPRVPRRRQGGLRGQRHHRRQPRPGARQAHPHGRLVEGRLHLQGGRRESHARVRGGRDDRQAVECRGHREHGQGRDRPVDDHRLRLEGHRHREQGVPGRPERTESP